MQNFTNMQKPNRPKPISIEKQIEKLLETLSIQVEGTEQQVSVDYTIKANDKFYEGIRNIIKLMYKTDKLDLLEKAKYYHYLNNTEWIDEEIKKIKG